jgi:hypothetical protein
MPTIADAQPATTSRNRTPRQKKPAEIVKTWVFDSVGNRKYALQIKKAGNGNPCLMFVEGVPQSDGTFRKFNITVWSEDFAALFNTLDQVRTYMSENDIKTPDGHKYDPNKARRFGGKR